jgi:hypothetical protein
MLLVNSLPPRQSCGASGRTAKFLGKRGHHPAARQTRAEIFHLGLEDITPRKLTEFRLHRLNRLHTVLGKAGRRSHSGARQPGALRIFCRLIVEDGLLHSAIVVEIGADGEVQPVASSGLISRSSKLPGNRNY